MSYTLKELREKPTDDLVREHDDIARTTVVGIQYFLDELARRDAIALAESVSRNTDEVADEVKRLYGLTERAGARMEKLTGLITLLTVINVAAAVIAAVAALSS